jgi:hypothetical protein|nr:MAG TPA: hypothetical protein [Caudoviricetes sp.]
MADNPITRKEKYLAKLTGSYTGNIPDPITRVEKYLYDLCQKGISGLTPEEIENAVNKYLKENPVQPGATTEQAQQIEQNKTDIALLKKETGSLKEDISTKITKFYASSQGETHLADSDNGKIQDMMLYGKSEQKRYSGKNLLNATLQTTTVNGVTCTANGDGTYTLNGTATTITTFDIAQDVSCSSFRLAGCPVGGAHDASYELQARTDNLIYGYDTGDGKNIKADENFFIRIRINTGINCNNLLFKPMITTDLTATYDDFEPYTGGQPSPSPDYPQEIKSVVNPAIKICGKNLLKATLQTTTVNGVTCTNNGDGTYTLNGTCTVSTALSIIGIFDHILNEPLYLTGVPSGCGSYLALSRYDGNNILVTDGKITKIDVGIHTKHIEFWITKGTTLNNVIFKPMITTDLTATYDDFEPYHEQTVTLPYTLNAIPVETGGNVTIDGQQYIADYVDVERGKLVRMVEKKVLNGTENWNLSERSENKNGVFQFFADANIAGALCDKAIYESLTSHYGTFDTWYNQIRFYAHTDEMTVEEWRNFLSSNNHVIYIVRNTPVKTDLTKEEITAFKALTTYYPTTNIFINSEQLDGYTVFNYPISMENGWNYVKQQIGDTRNYIYDMDARTQDTDLQAAEAYVNSEYAVALTELEV